MTSDGYSLVSSPLSLCPVAFPANPLCLVRPSMHRETALRFGIRTVGSHDADKEALHELHGEEEPEEAQYKEDHRYTNHPELVESLHRAKLKPHTQRR